MALNEKNSLTRTTSDNADFQHLVSLLDAYLAIIDGDEHAFYAQYNKTAALKNVVVYYENNIAVGCGALKIIDNETVEIKRMYVEPDFRGKGIAAAILRELEQWANELNYTNSILETGKKQEAAISLYLKEGYHIITNYGQYENVGNSVCMKKMIK